MSINPDGRLGTKRHQELETFTGPLGALRHRIEEDPHFLHGPYAARDSAPVLRGDETRVTLPDGTVRVADAWYYSLRRFGALTVVDWKFQQRRWGRHLTQESLPRLRDLKRYAPQARAVADWLEAEGHPRPSLVLVRVVELMPECVAERQEWNPDDERYRVPGWRVWVGAPYFVRNEWV